MKKLEINEARIGRYGRKLLAYMKEYNRDMYTKLLFTRCLEDWLIEQNEIFKARVCDYAQQIAKAQNIDENLKAYDQILRVSNMNAIKAQAEEIILYEIIYEKID